MSTSQPLSFPADREGQTYVSVQAAVAGHVWLQDSRVYEDAVDASPDVGSWVPAFSFLISHPTKGKALFDLGVRKYGEGYPPALIERIKSFKPDCMLDVADVLQAGGVDPAEVDTIIFSHMHWDHIGDPERIPRARIILGGASRPLLDDPYPPNPNSRFLALPAGRPVEYIDFQPPPSAESANIISPFGPFDVAYDLYDDGSLYLVDAPGHVAGHMLAAARVGPDAFVLLSGDTCHGRCCYHGAEAERRTICSEMYADWELAKETVGRLARVDAEMENVVVVLAHEKEREREMPLFPLELNGWVIREVGKRREKEKGTDPGDQA